jgi:hypothetical protein
VGRIKYKADFIMIADSRSISPGKQTKIVLEMQGGGETSMTGNLTKHVEAWEKASRRSNSMLSQKVEGTNPIITNAWRRQQEQFLVKGNIAQQTGGAIVFCVGAPLYDYLWLKEKKTTLTDLRQHNWTLALIGFSESTTQAPQPGPIPITVDKQRLLFTSYITFVQTLINQGGPAPGIFKGHFSTLAGGNVFIS